MRSIEQAIEALEQSKQYAQNDHPAGSDWSDVYDACDEAIAALRAQPDVYNVWVEGVHIPDDVVKKAVFLYMTEEPRKATRDQRIANPGIYEVREPKQ